VIRAGSIALLSGFALGVLAGTAIPPLRSAGRPAVGASVADPSAGQRADWRAVVGVYAAEPIRVIDGDTFEARVQVWPGLTVTTKVRLRGIDAPEMTARCAHERSKAEAARATLQSILADGDLTVLRVGLDRFGGRVIAEAATRRTGDVSAALIGQGVARAYAGGRRDGWC
jgi:endonuclease YncB( thermonuclease family)